MFNNLENAVSLDGFETRGRGRVSRDWDNDPEMQALKALPLQEPRVLLFNNEKDAKKEQARLNVFARNGDMTFKTRMGTKAGKPALLFVKLANEYQKQRNTATTVETVEDDSAAA